MKTEIVGKTYKTYYEATNFNASAFEEVLKLQGYDVGNLTVNGNLDFRNSKIRKLVGIKEVKRYLDLMNTPIEDLGNLRKVEGSLWLTNTPIEDIGNLREVGGSLNLENTPISQKYSEEDIRKMVKVAWDIYI